MTSSQDYIPLLSGNFDDSLHKDPQNAPVQSGNSRAFKFVVAASILAILSSVTNLVLAGLASNSIQPKLIIPDILNRPNPYIGLEIAGVGLPRVEVQPVTNLPLFMGQISSVDVRKVFLDIPKKPTPHGTVYPLDRNFSVSHDLSTVVQFRIMDFQMERCTLMAEIPTASALEAAAHGRLLEVSPETPTMDVWELDTTVQLDGSTLSYATRPKRKGLVGTWELTRGAAQKLTGVIGCPSRSLLTFEIACRSPGCSLKFRQDEYPPFMAIYLQQAQNPEEPRVIVT